MMRISATTMALITAVAMSSPASAQQFEGVNAILDDGPVTIVVEGVNSRDERLKSAAERELDATRVYENGAFHTRSFGGDTHRNRAARSGGNILNIFNLGSGSGN